jgi:hypothetical protein
MAPHLDVQATVRTAFAQFDRLGSANAVLRYFRDPQLLIPGLFPGGRAGHAGLAPSPLRGKLSHLDASGVCSSLHFGRRHHAAGRVPGEQTPRTRGPVEAWQVLVPDVSPAYILWEPYLQHRERLLQHQGQFAPRPGVPCQGRWPYCKESFAVRGVDGP